MHRKAAISLALVLLLAALGTVYAFTEHITNGTFNTDVSSWAATTSGSLVFAGTEGHLLPGAAQVSNLSSVSTASSHGARQCVTVNPGQYYTVKGWAKVPSGQTAAEYAFIRVQFYTSTSCSTSTGASRDSSTTTVLDTWQQMTKTTESPADAQSAYVNLYIRKTGSDSAYAYFDDITFYDSTANAVTLSSFSAAAPAWPGVVGKAGFLGGALFALAGLILLRRRRTQL